MDENRQDTALKLRHAQARHPRHGGAYPLRDLGRAFEICVQSTTVLGGETLRRSISRTFEVFDPLES